jgi:Kef-type K+ transport system membrane component KefB
MLVIATAITLAAIIGKQLCSLGVIGDGFDRLSVGLGMVPRGEVGLIFANVGTTWVVAGQPLLNRNLFSAIVIMVMVTTVIMPPALRWNFWRAAPQSRR